MTSSDCQQIRLSLGPFLDGELRGAEMLPVAQHVANCTECADEMERVQSLGQWLRSAAAVVPESTKLDGLASSVVSRVCAEAAQSWPAKLNRAREDWHWALVGVGSLAAAFVSILFVGMILHFGPAPQREDSLSAILMNLTSPPGDLYMRVTEGGDRGSVVVQLDNGEAARVPGSMTAMPAGLGSAPSEREMLERLMVLLSGTESAKVQTSRDHRTAEVLALIAEIRRARFSEPTAPGPGPVAVHELWLSASTSVSAKAL